MNRRTLFAVAALLVALPLTACRYDPGESTDTLPVTRIATIPAGATLRIVDSNKEWITPCDITDDDDFDIDVEITVSKSGYHTFQGTLEDDVPQIALGTYQITLKKID